MTSWISPLDLKTWILQVFSGSNEIFTAVALMSIVGISAYFRMNLLNMFYFVGLFLWLFFDYTDKAILFLLLSIAALLIGNWIGKLVTR